MERSELERLLLDLTILNNDLKIGHGEPYPDMVLPRVRTLFEEYGFDIRAGHKVKLGRSKVGYIDLYMKKGDTEIALEYSPGVKVRNKSIQKINTLKPKIAIFMLGEGCPWDQDADLDSIGAEEVYLVSIIRDQYFWCK